MFISSFKTFSYYFQLYGLILNFKVKYLNKYCTKFGIEIYKITGFLNKILQIDINHVEKNLLTSLTYNCNIIIKHIIKLKFILQKNVIKNI